MHAYVRFEMGRRKNRNSTTKVGSLKPTSNEGERRAGSGQASCDDRAMSNQKDIRRTKGWARESRPTKERD